MTTEKTRLSISNVNGRWHLIPVGEHGGPADPIVFNTVDEALRHAAERFPDMPIRVGKRRVRPGTTTLNFYDRGR